MRGILVVFGLILAFLFARVAGPLWGSPGWFAAATLILAALVASILWLPLVYWRSSTTEVSASEEILEKAAHVSMGLVSFLLLCAVLRELAWAGILLAARLGTASEASSTAFRDLLGAPGSKAILFASLALFLVGFIQAARGARVRVVRVDPGMDLPEGFVLRVVQVSDLHVGTWIRREYVEQVARRIESLGAIDLLVLTGDIGDGDPLRHRTDLEPLGRLRAGLGRFSVTGNHEGYWSEQGWNLEIERLGFRVLDNSSAPVSKDGVEIAVAGVRDLKPDVERASRDIREDAISILLAHQPKHAEAAKAYPIRLALCGHTHAGQFIPWAWIIGFFHRYPRGLYRDGDLAIHVNPGTGFWGPPVRLGTRSEITLLEIRKGR
jgi:predicted MPP superfamily phosphohydrolase